jgi:hypothetical protein
LVIYKKKNCYLRFYSHITRDDNLMKILN